MKKIGSAFLFALQLYLDKFLFDGYPILELIMFMTEVKRGVALIWTNNLTIFTVLQSAAIRWNVSTIYNQTVTLQ